MNKDEILKLAFDAGRGAELSGRALSLHRSRIHWSSPTRPTRRWSRHRLPQPLEPVEQPLVHYEWIKMPDSSGFGSYTESGMVLPLPLQR